VENGELRVILRGHHDLIHDLQWSLNDDFLLSASADCSLKIWNLSSLRDPSDTYTDKLNYTENDVKYFVDQLLHPSFVYGGGFYPDTAEERD
jgi:WD40 repeat protein